MTDYTYEATSTILSLGADHSVSDTASHQPIAVALTNDRHRCLPELITGLSIITRSVSPAVDSGRSAVRHASCGQTYRTDRCARSGHVFVGVQYSDIEVVSTVLFRWYDFADTEFLSSITIDIELTSVNFDLRWIKYVIYTPIKKISR